MRSRRHKPKKLKMVLEIDQKPRLDSNIAPPVQSRTKVWNDASSDFTTKS
jgi:hypothetical protein